MIDIDLAMSHPGIFISSIVAAATAIVDSATDFSGWENLGIKTLLIIAVLYLVKELTRCRVEAKADSAVREERANKAMTDVADALKGVTDAVGKQTEYFQLIAKPIIEKQVNNHNP